MTRRKASVLLFALAVVTCGYLSAWLSLTACAELTYTDIQQRGVVGTDLNDHRIPIKRSDVSASVVGPFVVETTYMVPGEFHGTVHHARFVTFFTRGFWLSRDMIHLI
ncbi:hypothetical protein GCM10023332_11490 [Luteimonas vadosa]|uniref:Uncharacterized protein n=1 Tax=Luteimonas vadosa TaxID=1165507 RepID=A0ABP9DXK7_9GAMM